MASNDIKRGKGEGFRDKASGKIWMTTCFSCGRENYAAAVASGTCAWCGHDPNKAKLTKQTKAKARSKGHIEMLILQDSLKMNMRRKPR